MCAEALSQDEIDALLRGETPPPPAEKPLMITPEEEDTIKAYAKLVCSSGKDVMSTLLGQEVTITLGEMSETDAESIASKVPGDQVVAEMVCKELVQGKSVLIMSVENALKTAIQMTGGGADSDFGDLEESAFGEAIHSMFSAVNNQLASQGAGEIVLDPVDITTKPPSLGDLLPPSSDRQILVEYQVSSGNVTGSMYQVIPRNLLESIKSVGSAPSTSKEPSRRSYASSAKTPEVLSAPAQFNLGALGVGGEMMGAAAPAMEIQNLELILDVKVEIKVELGRTTRKIKDVLELGPGSVVELERLAGEPVDILVNDKLFAKGEVVVIDENFGVRITDILSIQERIEALK